MPFIESASSPLLDKGSLMTLSEMPDGNSKPDDMYTNICTGFGVAEKLPVRVAAYALPVLQMGEQQPQARTEFYIAVAFAQKLNQSNPEQVRTNIVLIKEYISLLRAAVGVTGEPVWLEERDPFEAHRQIQIKTLAAALKEKASDRIKRFADARNGDESLEYIAAHALYMWDTHDIDPDLFITHREQPPESLLVIGGPAEKLFSEARQILTGTFPQTTSRRAAQGFTEIGRRPPYYPVEGELVFNGEKPKITFDLIKALPDADVLRDTLYLVVSLSEIVAFGDIPCIKSKNLTSDEVDDLEAACDKLQAIISQLVS